MCGWAGCTDLESELPLPQEQLTGSSRPVKWRGFIAYQIMLVLFLPQQARIDLYSSGAGVYGSGGLETLGGQSLTSCTG